MPDPVVFACALTLSAFVSAAVVAVARLTTWPPSRALARLIGVLAITASVLAGYLAMKIVPSWPPANALDRFLTILLPATIILELAAGLGVRPKIAIPLRAVLCLILSPVIWYGSIYLNRTGTDGAWELPAITIMMLCSFGLALGGWGSIQRLTERSVPPSVSFGLAMALFTAGITTMLGGYIKGGAGALPIAAALASMAMVVAIRPNVSEASQRAIVQGTVGIGVVSLFCLLCIGRFFGNVSSTSAIVILLAPHLCWVTEHSNLRSQAAWKITLVRIIAVLIPLGAVLIFAAIKFRLRMAPLLVVMWRES